MTVTQLLAAADVEEISEWMAYFDLEDPETSDWQRTSLIASNIVNMASLSGQRKYPKAVESDHFVPKKRARLQTPKAQIDTLKALFPGQ